MIVDHVLADLTAKRITLSLNGDRLRYRAPEGALTPELRAIIAQYRNEIVDRLRAGVGSIPDATRCVACERHDWIDQPPKDGVVRTTCSKCGRFIGYRPERP